MAQTVSTLSQSRAITATEFISGNYYLSESEMQNNAELIYFIMYNSYGWTLEAISGMLGNMERESTINPGIWESLVEAEESGFGLVQWTPSTNYTDWANNLGVDITDGWYQCFWIGEETTEQGQWIETDEYPISFEEFYSSTDSPENLASVFLKNFERAGVEAEIERQENARKWYDYLLSVIDGGETPVVPKKKKMPLWMMCRRLF